MRPDRVPTPLSELVDTLWLERRLLEYLLFKLVEANLILTADLAAFVPLAVDEVEQVLARVRSAEQHRDRVLAATAAELGVPTEVVTLEFLAAEAPELLRPSFAEHRRGFLELVAEIERVTRENRKLAAVNLDSIRGTLGIVGGEAVPTAYDSGGRPATAGSDPTHLDRAI